MVVDKRAGIDQVVKGMKDGVSIVIGGWGPSRKPMALIRAIAGSSLKDLTILSYAAIDLDLLIGAGKVKTAVFGFVAFDGAPGQVGNFNRARSEGSVEIKESDEYIFACQFKAAADRIPFYPVRGGIGTDILTVNPEIQTIKDPYNGETLVAIPAFTPDYAIIHVNEADQLGNGRIIGDAHWDRLFVRAADKVILSAEKIVPVGEIRESAILSTYVDRVVEAPQGALPGSCYPDYAFDAKELARYGKATKDPEDFEKYLQEMLKGD
ncbi:MAG: CoA transferase subunit A [Deltaproteobacteria bacterium]|nr:CoA transferase subunit A [Deltaproteobacteria bacterium]